MSYRILVTNDDGCNAVGLVPLIHRLSNLGKVYVVVPDQSRSSVSHGITLTAPLRVYKDKYRINIKGKPFANFYIVSGTPADCVRLGILNLCLPKIHLVVSGINHGANLGNDVVYSGTVAAAREATMLNVPALAVSLVWQGKGNFYTAAGYATRISNWLLRNKLPAEIFFNLNVPDLPISKVRGLTVTRVGKRIYDESIDVRKDPRGLDYYWLGGKFVSGRYDYGTDLTAIKENRCSLSPLKLDSTAVSFIPILKKSFTRIRLQNSGKRNKSS